VPLFYNTSQELLKSLNIQEGLAGAGS